MDPRPPPPSPPYWPPPGAPSGPARRVSRRAIATVVALGALLLVAAAAFVVPIPLFYVFEPGPVVDVERLVRVQNGKRTYSSEGELFLTTVGVDVQVTAADVVRAAFDAHREVILKSSYTQGLSDRQIERQARAEMEESQTSAKEVALAELGVAEPVAGVRVVQVVAGSPAEGQLQDGDVLLEIEGQPACAPTDVVTLLSTVEVGDEVDVKVRRATSSRSFRIETAENPQLPGQPFLGVQLGAFPRESKAGEGIEFKTGRIGGPSAGLMMALALYDRLTPDDITAGRDIAGSGTVSCNGTVGPIGGVGLKVAAAEAEGIDIFLTPEGDYEAARRAAEDVEIVSIATFDDALDYLEDLD
jgi:Lon-like protease